VLISQRPSLTEEPIADNRSRFVIEPLEPGFGYTLGNSLRRTLLSSIPGAAVTSIRIDGVLHEFTTVEAFKEDVNDIILNLKELVISSESDEPCVMYLRSRARRGHRRLTSHRRRVSPCTTRSADRHDQQEGRLEIELVVERGRGYVTAVQNKQPARRSAVSRRLDLLAGAQVTYAVEATVSSSAPTSTVSSSMSRPSRR